MALVSPGIQISINDQSQYVNNNVGSVPLVILATAQNKTYNGSPAVGTSKANAGKLLSFTSQRDLVTQMGTPTFPAGSTGTPVNGSEINEYGLLAAYSALGLGNRLFAIRADVDLNQLTPTSNRPTAAPANLTYWLNLASTAFGLYVSNAATQTFASITPRLITNANQVVLDGSFTPSVSTPIGSVGSPGEYALVFVNPDGSTPDNIRLYYKATTNSALGAGLNNTWVQVGSSNWQKSVPVLTGTVASPTLVGSSTLTINSIVVTTSITDTTVTQLAGDINAAAIPGIYANVDTLGRLQLFVTSAATSNGSTVDGKMIIADGLNTPLALCGVTLGTYNSPSLFYGSYAQEPTSRWFGTAGSGNGRPTGSIWWKTTATGSGYAPILSQYSSANVRFDQKTAPLYINFATAINALDPVGGGVNIAAGQVITTYGTSAVNSIGDQTANNLQYSVKGATSSASATGGAPAGSISGTFTIQATVPGSASLVNYGTFTASAISAQTLVQNILSYSIPYVTATYNASGTITLTHTTGGIIVLTNVSGNVLGTGTGAPGMGFYSGAGTGYTVNTSTGIVTITNFTNITNTLEYSASTPYSQPESGTYWYYSNPADADILINDGTGWKGYLNGGVDVRGYNLGNANPGGCIVAASEPISQSDGTALVAGDLWLDVSASGLAAYPTISRYNGSSWTAIDTTDHVTSAGIVFADARWDTGGTVDIITGDFPSIAALASSNYLDQDAPDYRLYPRGMLLWNTRRGGYNVKKYIPDYFNSTSFPNPGIIPGTSMSLPTIKDCWVSASGLDSQGRLKAGASAQRAIVVSAMQAAIDSNLEVLEPNYQFNLIAAPGYPEVIPNMIALNDNRGATAFIIGDTPMDLEPNTVAITEWASNTGGDGLPSTASASPYLALYYPAGLTNDLDGNSVVVPASHAVLRTYLYNDNVAYPWFAPAGTRRGLVNNLSDVGYIDNTTGSFVHNAISQGLRDALYVLRLNPITQLPGTGLVVWGQVTRSGSNTARDRVNVSRLENYLRTIFATVANGYLFEPNDSVTRKSIASQIESSLHDILSKRGIYDFLVICDSSNNTASTIANNQLYVDVAIEPMKDVEFIYIPIAIYNPGAIAALNTASS
jgi:hypothetical protein